MTVRSAVRRIVCWLIGCNSICVQYQEFSSGAVLTGHVCERCGKMRSDQWNGVPRNG